MASLLIEDIDDALWERLERSATANDRSLGDEARERLRLAMAGLDCDRSENIVDAARRLFGPEHGFDLDLPDRSKDIERPPPDFSEGF